MEERGAPAIRQAGFSPSVAIAGAFSLIICVGLIAYLGYRLGSAERDSDPVSWWMSNFASTVILAGAVAGVGSGLAAIACRRLWTVSLTAWVLCAGILTVGWAYGMAEAGSAYPTSDLQRVFVSALIVAVTPALVVSAVIYGVRWQLDRTHGPHVPQLTGHDDTA